MMLLSKILIISFIFLINLFSFSYSFGDNHNIYETLELIQKDIKTLEKAIYSGSVELDNKSLNSSNLDANAEDVLTRHLLKLSEIENQFQQLTNRFEEINFINKVFRNCLITKVSIKIMAKKRPLNNNE